MRTATAACMMTLFCLLGGCAGEQAPETAQPAEAAPVKRRDPNNYNADCRLLRDQALRTDSLLLVQTETDDSLAAAAISDFTGYSYYCRRDTLAPYYLIKAAQVARAVNKHRQAEQALRFCIEEFRDFRDRPAAIFLLAQLYEDESYMQDRDEARELYNKVIAEHPRSVWAENARSALAMVGKTDAEIIRMFEQKNK